MLDAVDDNLKPACDAALRDICESIRTLLVATERDEVLARYSAGELLRGTKRAPHTYGLRSIERVAQELGMAPRLLYRYIEVAEAWSEKELRLVLERKNRFGQPLSWTHFLALSAATGAKERASLIAECLQNAWSARELERRVREARPRRFDAARDGETVHAALREGIQTAGRMHGDVRRFEEALAERLSGEDENFSDELLERALETFEHLQNRVDSAVAKLRAARHSKVRLRCPPPGNPEGARVEAPRSRTLASDEEEAANPESRLRRARR